MKVKKLAKILAVVLATALASALAVGLTACSGSSKTLTDSYSYHTYSEIAYGLGWKIVDSYTLETYSDDSYVLTYKQDYFGDDFENRGLNFTVTTGTYTSTASADGDATHLDLTLSAADTVIRTESGKIAQNGMFTLNSEKWNSKMTESYTLLAGEGASFDSDDAAKEAFIAQFGGGYTVTIQEPSLDAEVPNLFAQIISITAAE